MKVIFNFFFILLMTLGSFNLFGQTDNELKNLMYSASTLNSELLWDKAISLAKSNYESSTNNEDLLQLSYAYYGRLGTCLSKRDKEKGEQIIELGLESAEKLSGDNKYESVANSLLAAFNGMSIAFSPMKGMFLGPRSEKQVSKALKLDSENAIGWLQKGSSEFNTPRIFGGSVEDSIESFNKSISCFEKDESKPLWMKIEAMIWLGQAHHYLEEYQKASEIYQAILEIAPGHQWVEKSLLPATLAKLNKQ